MNSISLCLNHTPWKSERVASKAQMLLELLPLSKGIPFLLHDADYRGEDWQGGGKRKWIEAQFRWAAAQSTTHHLFMTDDLHLMPGFWRSLESMIEAKPYSPIGLLSNHPDAPRLADAGHRWYSTQSWLVGPAYVIPHELMIDAWEFWQAMPEAAKIGPQSWNDDNYLNMFVSRRGLRTLHPLPTIIEHRSDLGSTVGHGDHHSRERVSWREERSVTHYEGGGFVWIDRPRRINTTPMMDVSYWDCDALPLGWPEPVVRYPEPQAHELQQDVEGEK